MHWQRLLREIWDAKQRLARLDAHVEKPVVPPAGASPDEIMAVERELGFLLPPSYRELLSVHDGVPNLYQGASLQSAHNLAHGASIELARRAISHGEPALIEGRRRGRWSLLPFGVDPAVETIFAWDLSAPRRDGELRVVLYSNGIGVQVESFASLLEFILAMLDADVDERLRAPWPSVWRSRPSALPTSAIDVAPARRASARAAVTA